MSDDAPVPHGPDEPTPEHRVAELERRLQEVEAVHRSALLQVGLRAEATRAGMVDLDGLKLVDTAGLTVDASGDLVGGALLMAGLRRSKPWLFGLAGSAASTSSAAQPPPSQPPRPRRATDMNHDEWQAARTELLRRF